MPSSAASSTASSAASSAASSTASSTASSCASSRACSLAPCLDSTKSMRQPARPANPCTHASSSSFSFSLLSSLFSSSSASSLTPPLHLLAVASLVLLGCPIPAACDPASRQSTAAITAALLSSSSLPQLQYLQQQQQQQQQRQQQQQWQHPKELHHPLQDRHQKQIQLQEARRRNQRRRLTESIGHSGTSNGRGSGRGRDSGRGRLWLMQGRSLTAKDADTDTGATFSSNFSSASRPSNLSTTETTLAGLLGVALALTVLGVCVCIVRKRRRARTWSLSRSEPSSFPIPSQSQQPAVPLYQPPETASSLSSFTRVSAAGPEMSSVLAAAGARSGGQASSSRSPSSSAVVGFSLARLFVRQPRGRGADKSGKSVYMHQKDPLQDWRSQKTPSPVLTRSSSHDYCWGDLNSKEYTKDGFPIITLTSPTNSESSIPIPVVTTEPIGASTSTAGTSSTCMPMSEQPPSGFLHHQVASNSALLKDMDETLVPVSEGKDSPTPLTDAADHQNLYILRPSVPPHMLLHPSSTYNRLPWFEKQALAPPSTSPPSLTDFPPTYEEAVDDSGVSSKTTKDDQGSSSSSNSNNSSSSGNSNNSSSSSNSNNSSNSGNSGNSGNSSSSNSSNSSSNHGNSGASEIMSIRELGPPAASLFPTMGSYSSPRVLSTESMDWASYRHRTEWNAEYGAEGENDPLDSRSLSNNH